MTRHGDGHVAGLAVALARVVRQDDVAFFIGGDHGGSDGDVLPQDFPFARAFGDQNFPVGLSEAARSGAIFHRERWPGR